MSEQQPTSSRGRVLKKTGMNDKKMDALNKIREMKDGNMKRTDQYEVSCEHTFLTPVLKFRWKRSVKFSSKLTMMSTNADRTREKTMTSLWTMMASVMRTRVARCGSTRIVNKSKARKVENLTR